MIERKEIIRILRRMKLEHGPTVCIGCGHEHGCGVHGCAVVNEAIVAINTAEADLANKQREIDALRKANEGLRYLNEHLAEKNRKINQENERLRIENWWLRRGE
ncbi:MAG: hypothetical protein KBS74_04080 [Clostridiales bacterium]|nr:hypothetical protein [Candidatus Cacconaster stercorequi]